MLQTQLGERFGMRLHRESREFNAYALVVTKGGPHLKPSEAPEPAPAQGVRFGAAHLWMPAARKFTQAPVETRR